MKTIDRSILFKYTNKELSDIKQRDAKKYNEIISNMTDLIIFELGGLFLKTGEDREKHLKLCSFVLNKIDRNSEHYQKIKTEVFDKNSNTNLEEEINAQINEKSEEDEIIYLISINFERQKNISDNDGYILNLIENLKKLKSINAEKCSEYLKAHKEITDIMAIFIKKDPENSLRKDVYNPLNKQEKMEILNQIPEEIKYKLIKKYAIPFPDLFSNEFNKKYLYAIKTKDEVYYNQLIEAGKKLINENLEQLISRSEEELYIDIKNDLISFAKNDIYAFINFIPNNYEEYIRIANMEIQAELAKEDINITNIMDILITLPQAEQEKNLNEIKLHYQPVFNQIKTAVNNNISFEYFKIISLLLEDNQIFVSLSDLDIKTNRDIHLLHLASFANSTSAVQIGCEIFEKNNSKWSTFYLDQQILYTLERIKNYPQLNEEIIILLCSKLTYEKSLKEAIEILSNNNNDSNNSKNIDGLTLLLTEYSKRSSLPLKKNVAEQIGIFCDKQNNPELTVAFNRVQESKYKEARDNQVASFIIRSIEILALVITAIVLSVSYLPIFLKFLLGATLLASTTVPPVAVTILAIIIVAIAIYYINKNFKKMQERVVKNQEILDSLNTQVTEAKSYEPKLEKILTQSLEERKRLMAILSNPRLAQTPEIASTAAEEDANENQHTDNTENAIAKSISLEESKELIKTFSDPCLAQTTEIVLVAPAEQATDAALKYYLKQKK